MANRRAIDSCIWDDEWFGQLSDRAQLIWIGIFSRMADDQGRLLDNPHLISSKLFPYKEIPAEDIESGLQEFEGHIIRYEFNGKRYIQIMKWWQNQPMQYATPSCYPAPAGWEDHYRTNYKRTYIVYNWEGQVDTPSGIKLHDKLKSLGRVSSWMDHVEALNFNPTPTPTPTPNHNPNNIIGINNNGVQPEKSEGDKSGADAPPPPEPEKVDGDKKPRRKKETPPELLITATPNGRVLHALLEAENRAKGRSTTTAFPSLACRDKWLSQVENRLNGKTQDAVKRAFEKGIFDIPGIVDFCAKYTGTPTAPAGKTVEPLPQTKQDIATAAFSARRASNGNG